jgi:predicted transposase YbfD/YdcC
VHAYGHGCDGRGGGWPGLRQVVHIRTTRTPIEAPLEPIFEDHYYLTSLTAQKPKGTPEALLLLARRHWEIENHLHHTKDRSLAEDADRNRRGAPAMARLRSLAIGLFRHIPGASIPEKQIKVTANPAVAVRLLKKKRFPRLF